MIRTAQLTENKTLRKVFLIAALGFLAVCGIGFLVSYAVDRSGVIKEALDQQRVHGGINVDIYDQLKGTGVMAKLARVSMVGIVLIIASSILNMVWAYRWQRASRGFIIFAWTLYVIAQGIGFGLMFLTWNATDLLAVFGIAGGMFGVMALIGYIAKDLSHWWKWLMLGSIVAIVAGLVMFIMAISGVYSDTLNMIVWGITGILTLAWTAFDVWWIKRATQMDLGQEYDSDMHFRMVGFFAFRLLSDLVALVWTVLRVYSRLKK